MSAAELQKLAAELRASAFLIKSLPLHEQGVGWASYLIDSQEAERIALALSAAAEHIGGAHNASLNSAGSELLEALQDALSIFEFGGDDKTVVAPKWAARAHAAIARATGAES